MSTRLLYCGFPSIVFNQWYVAELEQARASRIVTQSNRDMLRTEYYGILVSEFYRTLLTRLDGKLLLEDVPYALDEAISKLQEAGADAVSCAIFRHMGVCNMAWLNVARTVLFTLGYLTMLEQWARDVTSVH
jgi:predicted YcjX-like family ATPase